MSWLAAFVLAAAAFGPAKPYGVLLLGEGGDRTWQQTVASAQKAVGAEVPLELAAGLADARAMQKAVDKLQSSGVKMIVAVPLFVSSYGEIMDQNRYLLGIREKPVKGYALGSRQPQRVRAKVPIVLAKALDDHPLAVELLAERAAGAGRDPGKEALLLVGPKPRTPESTEEWLDAQAALAEKVRQKIGAPAAAAAALDGDGKQAERELSERALKKTLFDLRRRHGAVAVVPLELTAGGFTRRLRRAVDGSFARFDGKTLMPDERVAKWIAESAASAAKLPDMRLFKENPYGFR